MHTFMTCKCIIKYFVKDYWTLILIEILVQIRIHWMDLNLILTQQGDMKIIATCHGYHDNKLKQRL